MIRSLILAAALAVIAAPASAQPAPEYWFIGASAMSSSTIDTMSFIDANSIETEGAIRRASVAGYMHNNAEGVEHIEAIVELNCDERTQRSIDGTVFFTGAPPAHSTQVAQWARVQPNTPGEWALNFACGSRDPEQYLQIGADVSLAETAQAMFGTLRSPK